MGRVQQSQTLRFQHPAVSHTWQSTPEVGTGWSPEHFSLHMASVRPVRRDAAQSRVFRDSQNLVSEMSAPEVAFAASPLALSATLPLLSATRLAAQRSSLGAPLICPRPGTAPPRSAARPWLLATYGWEYFSDFRGCWLGFQCVFGAVFGSSLHLPRIIFAGPTQQD